MRDHEGRRKGGFSKYLENCSAVFAEFQRVFEGLKITKMLNFRKIELNADLLIVAKVLEDRVIGITE